ncbi:MAG TPA: hypothetical protein VF338_01785 [Leptolinea sp.]
MNNLPSTHPTRSPLGWIAVTAGVILFIAGISIRNLQPGTLADTRLLEGFGILLTGWGIIPLFRGLSARRDPAAAHRSQLAETDERAVAIRNQAAYIAFMFSMGCASIILLVYSACTRGQVGFDPLWFALAFLVIAPAAAFVGIIIWHNRQ